MTVPQSIRKNVIINKITHIYYNMRKNVILMGALLMASMSMMAQTGKGGISAQMIQQMEK